MFTARNVESLRLRPSGVADCMSAFLDMSLHRVVQEVLGDLIVRLFNVPVVEVLQVLVKFVSLPIRDLEATQDLSNISSDESIVENGQVPSASHAFQEFQKRTRSLWELEAEQSLVRYVFSASDNVSSMRLRQLVRRDIRCVVGRLRSIWLVVLGQGIVYRANDGGELILPLCVA